MGQDTYDAIVVGGGPAGSAAAVALARRGFSAVVLERTRFPRFHVGESLLPEMMRFVRELGLGERLAAIPQVDKRGATFVNGDGEGRISFYFSDSLGARRGADCAAFNVERAAFDNALLSAARDAGAEVREEASVRAIRELADRAVRLEVEQGGDRREVRGRWLLDASGQATLVARHLGTRQVIPEMKKVAYFGQYEGVPREPMPEGGFIIVVVCREGWFWLIPVDERRTSIGFVADSATTRQIGVPADAMLAWAISRCPFVAERTAKATPLAVRGTVADFSYRCQPYAGPGYFLLGDAATFIDPIFSTGVCLGMGSALSAVDLIARLERGEIDPAAAQRSYSRSVRRSSAPFFRLVDLYYRPAFRDLLFDGSGPFEMHRAIISILAGHVVSGIPFDMRWRLWAFRTAVALQRHLPLVTRREMLSLLEDPAV